MAIRDLYIDGDIFVNKAAFAAEKAGTSPSETVTRFRDYFNHVITKARDDHYVTGEIYVGIQGKDNYRYGIAQIRPYKGTRKKTKPAQLGMLRDLVVLEYGGNVVNKMETDDWLGLSAERGVDAILTSDKDLLQVPGIHLRLTNSSDLTSRLIDDREGMAHFYTSMLVGDPTDNIMGCPGIGKVTADNVIRYMAHDTYSAANERMFKAVCNHYIKWLKLQCLKEKGKEPDLDELAEYFEIMFNENANLLWIQRRGEPMYKPPYSLESAVHSHVLFGVK